MAEEPREVWIPAHPIEVWTTDTVVSSLKKHISKESLEKFKERKINGKKFVRLNMEKLAEMGIREEDREPIIRALKKIMSEHQGTVFNDPVHGHIELHPLMVKFMDTPQFQRLRYIKQLGGAYYVFPGASHNRFEHSVGVCHLAGELVETLRRKQRELGITDEDVLCVKLAGLCHDLGHGPFSHLFEKIVQKGFKKDDWKHDKQSGKMFDFLIKENDLDKEMKKYKLGEMDKKFIKTMILGLNPETYATEDEHGRGQSKRFLFEIVANKRNEVDVDKFDYFARDCHHLGISNGFDFRRYMKFARVIEVDRQLQICIRDKEVYNVYELFHTRHMLHLRAYKHKTCNIIEHMIKEALVEAKDFIIVVPEKQGEVTIYREVTLADATDDEGAYTLLTDQVLQQIMSDTKKELKEAKKILERVEARELYKFVGQKIIPTEMGHEELCTDMLKHLPTKSDKNPTEDDIIMLVVKYDYGKKEENPIDYMNFFRKEDPDNAQKIHKNQVSRILPSTFKDVQVQVFCKNDNKDCFKAARSCFMAWCKADTKATPET